MLVEKLTRVFVSGGNPLTDPDTTMSPAQVKDFWTTAYPELTNAEITGPVKDGTKLVYTFNRSTGTKGSSVQPSSKGTIPSFMKRLEKAAGEAPIVKSLPGHEVNSLRQTLTPQFGGQSLQLPSRSCPLLV